MYLRLPIYFLCGLLFLLFPFESNSQTINKAWEINATDTSSSYTPAYLGNGLIGLRSQRDGLSAKTVHINGLYERSLSKDNIRLVNEYNPLLVDFTFKNGEHLQFNSKIKDWHQNLLLREGLLETSYDYGDMIAVKTQLVALQNFPVGAMCTYQIDAKKDIEFVISNTMRIPDYHQGISNFAPLLDYKVYRLSSQSNEYLPIMSTRFYTESGTDCVGGANTYYFDDIKPELAFEKKDSTSQQVSFRVFLKKGEKFTFCILSVFQHSGLTVDPYNDAIRLCSREYALGYKNKLLQHEKKWAQLWNSDIQITGDPVAQINVRLALYCLYSSITPGFDLSISDCGIQNEWGGHVFWDAELWMYPPLLIMQPKCAASIINFRLNTLQQAKIRAAEFGYKGAMYPWESDLTGNECTSVNYKLDMTEHHITADISIAAWNYYRITQDKKWLKQRGFPLLKAVADFWVSRVSKGYDGYFHINGVVGPDEYAEDVNDDAFTNAAVKLVLNNTIKAAKLVNEPTQADWVKIANRLVILKKDGHTLQNSTYDGRMIKQADVNLLAFPLNQIKTKDQILRDLEYYEPRINPQGPSMSYSVLATSYARIGKPQKAYDLFLKSFLPNLKTPFNILSERSTNNITPFCTGYGGILQTVIWGFAGLDINDRGLHAGNPHLPKNWKKLVIKMAGKKDIVCLNMSKTK